jgi:16S rRNA (uracil1498-N3)-methyltransferase
LFLTGREAHHAQHVLRIRRGDRVKVLDGEGHEFDCEADGADRDKVRLRVVEKRLIPPFSWRITLLQALPRGKLIESIIQKATELGVWRIVPLLSERVVTRLSEKPEKAGKWQSAAIEAIKQCGSPWLPRVEPAMTPNQFLARNELCDLALLGSLQPGARHPRNVLNDFQARQGSPPKTVHVWIGPEGDFTPTEISSIESRGALSITLGPLVLRTETAAIYCLSVLNYELQYSALIP